MKAKTIRAWAIVKKADPKINLDDVYKDKSGIGITKEEKFIRVEIKEVVK